MSIRAAVMRLLMRTTIKRQFASIDDIDEFRKRIDKLTSMMPKLPDGVSVVPVTCNEVPCEWVTFSRTDQNRVLLYLHGGGYVFGNPEGHRDLTWRLSRASGMRVLVADYRLAPEHPFPAALEDATNCYRWLINEGYAASNIAIGGDSAGGGLALATLVHLKNLGMPMPAAAILLSPWTDLSGSGDSVQTNAAADPMLSPASLHRFAGMYMGDLDTRAPLASPLFADLSGLPAVMVQVGSTEVLLSDAERLAEKIRIAGGEISLEVWPRMPHVWQVFASRIPEGERAIRKLGQFLRDKTDASRRTEKTE